MNKPPCPPSKSEDLRTPNLTSWRVPYTLFVPARTAQEAKEIALYHLRKAGIAIQSDTLH